MCILRGVLNVFGGNKYNNDQSPESKPMERRQISLFSGSRPGILVGNTVPEVGRKYGIPMTAEICGGSWPRQPNFPLPPAAEIPDECDGEHMLGAYLNGCAATRSSANSHNLKSALLQEERSIPPTLWETASTKSKQNSAALIKAQNTSPKPQHYLISVKNEVTYLTIKSYVMRAELTSIVTPSANLESKPSSRQKAGPYDGDGSLRTLNDDYSDFEETLLLRIMQSSTHLRETKCNIEGGTLMYTSLCQCQCQLVIFPRGQSYNSCLPRWAAESSTIPDFMAHHLRKMEHLRTKRRSSIFGRAPSRDRLYSQWRSSPPLGDIKQSTNSINDVFFAYAPNDQDVTSICLAEKVAMRQSQVADVMRAYDKIISICLAEKVAIRQSQVAAEYGSPGISGDERANILSQQPALQRMQRQLPEQECYSFLQESDSGATSLPVSQPSSDLLPGTSVYANHGVSTPLRSFAPQNDTSIICHQEPPPCVVRCSQEKMQCTWPGCSSVIQKGSYVRHVKEIHQRTVKAPVFDEEA
ncbi:hypothetical protein M405DRAFT_841876 [Rhizopogon salebrosus TDB-379]|nr:hypothetical protein M405DRAFT_841876 [Rhizopogon salebrosus TDB-379]